MEDQTFGIKIATLRKEKGMTQSELADKMAVTDKAVSKWERGLSLPDIWTIVRLAKIFDVSVDELVQVKIESKGKDGDYKVSDIIDTALKGVALAMGIAVVVLSVLNELEVHSGLGMLGIGLACLSVSLLKNK